MTDNPVKNSQGLVTCTIYSSGTRINNSFGLLSVWIRKEVNRIGKATLVFLAGNLAAATMQESEDDTFAPGKKIRVEGGYQSVEHILFEGIVTAHRVEVAAGTTGQLIIECRDYAFPATLQRRNRIFRKVRDDEAITEILAGYKELAACVTTAAFTHPELVQYYCTDWDFILSRAAANGWVVITEGTTLTLQQPAIEASPVLEVGYGRDLREFSGSLESAWQVSEVEAWAWDAGEQQLIKVKGSASALNKQGNCKADALAKAVGDGKWILQTESCAGKELLKAWADARMLQAGLARIQGKLSFQGNAKVKPGVTIRLNGMGERFDGNAYIGWVEHEIRDGEWITEAGMGLSPLQATEQPDVMAAPAAGLLPGIRGLHIAKVVKLNEDPGCENKIAVEFPLLNGEKNSVWARLSNFWAGKGYGAFFLPDIGDEVVIGFLNNDPCYAIVLGSLYSSNRTPPYEFPEKNTIRALVTSSGMKLEFEEEKKHITLSTPAGKLLEISDEGNYIRLTDQYKNKIEMAESGICIESSKALSLKAKTDILLEAGAAAGVQAKSDLSLKGMNIEAKANTNLTLKATAKAELSASGQTVISGALVKIN